MFPEKHEGPALLSFESLFPTRQPHENNSYATLDYSHLSFGEVQHRSVIQGNVSNLVLNLVGDLDPGSSPARQKKNLFSEPYAILIINWFIKHYYFVIKKILKHTFQMFRVMLEFSDHMYSATLTLIFLTLT